MTTPIRFASTISLAALATMIAGCATPQKVSGLSGKADNEVGLATRAVAAMTANNLPAAVDFAERAVQKTPDDAGLRTLLGNAYFASGRFWSAESAYKDSLSISSNQPQVILKLALMEVALGKKGQALAFLDAGRSALDPADYGLAMALAGANEDALAVLQTAARSRGADARVRQNLALAYALSGDWTNARIVAAQDVPGNLLDARIQQWMQLADPSKPAAQVAALVGVTPAAVDHGQPVQLALVKPDARLAQAIPAPQPVAAAPAAPQPQVAMAEAGYFAEAAPVSIPPAPPPPRARVAHAAPEPVSTSAPAVLALAAAAVTQAPVAVAALAPKLAPKLFKAADVRPAAAPKAKRAPVRAAALRTGGKSPAVVQLGAYGSPDRVLAAWNSAARKYAALRAYMPMSARFASQRGVVYRLSVKGFASNGEANALCASLRAKGGSCFVRNFAGDAPVNYASR